MRRHLRRHRTGEALTFYAVFGVLVLLPSSWLPRSVVATGAAVLIPASLALTGDGLTLIPGMFLLGSALVRYELVAGMDRSGRTIGRLFVGSTAASVPALLWRWATWERRPLLRRSQHAGPAPDVPLRPRGTAPAGDR